MGVEQAILSSTSSGDYIRDRPEFNAFWFLTISFRMEELIMDEILSFHVTLGIEY